MSSASSRGAKEFLARPRRSPDFGTTAEFTKVVEAAHHKLMLAGDGKAVDDVKAQLVEKFTQILAERDARIESLEAELVKLGGSVARVEVDETATDDDDEFADYIERIAKSHP